MLKIQSAMQRFRTLAHYARQYGLPAALSLVKQRLISSKGRIPFLKHDLIAFYEFVALPAAAGDHALTVQSDDVINWFIPPFGKGSGGHLNIFRFIFNLEQLGFNCRIIIVGEPVPESAVTARKNISEWFFPLKAEVFIGLEKAPPACFSVATEWRTAYWVRHFEHTLHRCYFVQDFEPWFYPMGSEAIFAEETYNFGFVGITAGGWLEKKLRTDYGMETHAVGFSYDRHLYSSQERNRNSAKKRIFFYARPPTPRRAFELGLLVLREVCRRQNNVEVVFAGWDVSNYAVPFPHVNAGLLDLEDLPKLYGSCDVALVLSLSNLSLLPLELMACGTPVVSNRAPWTEWLLNDGNAKLAKPLVADLADALCEVINHQHEADRLRQGGFATVAKTDWQTEASTMAEILRRIRKDKTLTAMAKGI